MSEEGDFEEQLRQEALAAQRSAANDDADGRTKVDPDGTVYEWDSTKRAWFPKIDEDFIAKYQMNYGSSDPPSSTTETETPQRSPAIPDATDPDYFNYYYSQDSSENPAPTDINSKEYREYYDKYYQQYYSRQQQQQEGGDGSTAVTDHTNDADSSPGGSDTFDYTKHYDSYEEYAQHYKEYYGVDPPSESESSSHTTEAGDASAAGHKSDEATSSDHPSESQAETKADEKTEKKRKAEEKVEWFKACCVWRAGYSGVVNACCVLVTVEWFQVDPNLTNNVYVSGLPDDITEDEFKDVMNKCGLITYDHIGRKLKLKLYMDSDGNYKGDGRCCYIKPESVDLAMQIIDGSEIRGHTIHVERATFTLKGEFDPKKKKRKLTNKEKKKIKEKQEKLLDWRPDKPADSRPRFHRVVIVKNAFLPSEFDKDPMQINCVRKDLQTECSKYGEVRKVTVYDRNLLGVASVLMAEPEEADTVVEAINGRWFAGRQIIAETWDGRTKYEVKESAEELQKRDEEWHKFLEQSHHQAASSQNAPDTTHHPPSAQPISHEGSTDASPAHTTMDS